LANHHQAACLANNCAYLGWVVPANTLLLINADIGPSANIAWASTGWTMGSSVGFLLFGRLTDIFGRKWGVLGTQILALIGVIVAATAKNVGALIAAETMIGIAAAGQLSFGIVIGELVPNKIRAPAITIIFLSALPFAVFGPSIGRAFIDNTAAGWRWSYYIGIICNALALLMYQFFYHPPKYDQLHVHGKTIKQQLMEFDWIGLFLYLAGVVLFLM
jgi:MFS family permease